MFPAIPMPEAFSSPEFWITLAALALGGGLAGTMAWLERRPRQSVNRVEHQKYTNAEPQINRVEVAQQDHADRDADRRAKRQRPDRLPVQLVAQFQDAVARVEVWRALFAKAIAQGDLTSFVDLLHASGAP